MSKKIKKIKSNKRIVIYVAIALLLTYLTATYGRYIYNGIRNYYLSTKSFYFNSDKLSEEGSYYQLDNWSGVAPVVVRIKMDSKKNNIVSSPDNINYDISFSCSTNITCTSTKTEGLIMNGSNEDTFAITMTPDGTLKNGDTVWLKVETNATHPYTKKLSGTFTIKVGEIGLSYEIVDKVGSPYLDFNITNTLNYYTIIESFGTHQVGDRIDINEYLSLSHEEKKKCAAALIKLSFDPRLFRIDMTNEAYITARTTDSTMLEDGYDYISSVTFKTEALSSTSVRFYKKNTGVDYSYPYVTQTPAISFSRE